MPDCGRPGDASAHTWRGSGTSGDVGGCRGMPGGVSRWRKTKIQPNIRKSSFMIFYDFSRFFIFFEIFWGRPSSWPRRIGVTDRVGEGFRSRGAGWGRVGARVASRRDVGGTREARYNNPNTSGMLRNIRKNIKKTAKKNPKKSTKIVPFCQYWQYIYMNAVIG